MLYRRIRLKENKEKVRKPHLKQDVLIIGGGASGLIAAITSARRNQTVTILERKDKVGKKILATGNGKCNYTNLLQNSSCYRSENPSFAYHIIEQFDAEATIAFFQTLGIEPKSKNGYMYPYSEQASAILDVLRMELERLGVTIRCEEDVCQIMKKDNGFRVKTQREVYTANKVLLCAGGKANETLGSNGSGYSLAKALGHTIVPVVPALTGLRSPETYFKGIAGVRVDANVTLVVEGIKKTNDRGELQLTAYGLSGIPIFQISRFAAKALIQKKKVEVIVDFLPDWSYDQVHHKLEERIQVGGQKTAEELLVGMFNRKLIVMLLKQANISLTQSANQLRKKQLHSLVSLIKELVVPIAEANPFEQAQVCAGGIDTKELNPETLESTLVKGLYVAGEVVDVDGICGGYNLQWAWSSGVIAGRNC